MCLRRLPFEGFGQDQDQTEDEEGVAMETINGRQEEEARELEAGEALGLGEAKRKGEESPDCEMISLRIGNWFKETSC